LAQVVSSLKYITVSTPVSQSSGFIKLQIAVSYHELIDA